MLFSAVLINISNLKVCLKGESSIEAIASLMHGRRILKWSLKYAPPLYRTKKEHKHVKNIKRLFIGLLVPDICFYTGYLSTVIPVNFVFTGSRCRRYVFIKVSKASFVDLEKSSRELHQLICS